MRRCPKCESENIKFLNTFYSFLDGDEDDWYECLDCHYRWYIYIPR